ncbi:hypothetical protein ACX9Q3_002106 [Klebsiella oxytoca]|uniref:hypothetical protein n=1 Tax=Enterobacteriaceae TaxID=543 RepID=UPI00165A0377|nr:MULTISPECIES: hypothetical protein [Enterobacteriaceae]HBR1132696.1 hypothetical protein [Klebsiella quasipneumoniae subsp. similipneumoniae]EKM7489205.1 hypothetical protein [Klebsiella pneumoniae]EKV3343546.1 hypothetical protein [Klebsiella pneumoniae]EKZ6090815.1 hypothetical protein [Klebsiella pneumoniae]MBC9460740.1 hypothetical protein [Escherichia coli]
MDHWGWVAAGAVFIWSIFGLGGVITNGGYAKASAPYTHYQAMNGSFGFVAAGIFLLFFYPYWGLGIGGFGLILFLKACIEYFRWKKQDRGENQG